MKYRQWLLIGITVLLFAGLLAGCSGNESVIDAPEQLVATIEGDAADPIPTAIPTSLVVCVGEAPNTLFPYGGPNQTAELILQAVYDGPIDHRSYAYQPVLMESLPEISAGTAVMQTVQVQTGDLVVDNQGNVVTLDRGVFIRPAGCFSGDCAKAFDGSQTVMDQMAAVFVLQPGITWSDGTPLTVEDSVYGFQLAADPDTLASKYKTSRTLSYEVLDANTLMWTGVPGFIDPTYQENFWQPAPRHLWEGIPAGELTGNEIASLKPLGYGSYLISETNLDTYILVRNPNYFRASEGLPLIDRVEFRVVGQDYATNLEMLQTGECDLLDTAASAGILAEEIIQLSDEGRIAASWADQGGWTLLNFGIVPQSYDDGYSIWASDRPDYFGDVRTRQAIAYCMDKEVLSKTATGGIALVMDSYLPNEHGQFSETVSVYRQDAETAGDLLDQVGWVLTEAGQRVAVGIEGLADGTPLAFELLYADHPQNEQLMALVSEQLATCGIDAAPVGMSDEALFATGEDAPIFGRNFDMAYFSWQSAEDPPCQLFLSDAIPGEDEDLFPYKWGGWNASGWKNEDYDAACRLAKGSAPGMETYADNHALAQQIFSEELPVIPLFSYQQAALARPDICGFELDATAGLLWNIEQIAFGGDCP
jgi:peptide/nickel transport system substrate-binding protein